MTLVQKTIKVNLSFLKREREYFALFFVSVLRRSALQPFTVPDRLHERSMNVSDLFRPLVKTRKTSETVSNGLRQANHVHVQASKTKESLLGNWKV